jgi:uroporphyrinogen decarboxylase
MNSRERVLTAMRRTGIPDRVPLQFDLSRPLIETLAAKYAVPAQYTTSYYEDLTYRISANELRIAMGSDCVVVGAGLPAGYIHSTTNDGSIINEFGMKMQQGLYWMDVVDGPFSGGASIRDVLEFPFPDPLDESRYEDAKKYIDRYKGDYFIIGDIEVTMFDFAWHMVGLERFLSDMATGEPYVEALIDRCMEFSLQVGKRLIQLGVDGIWGADDFGTQNGMMISPSMFRRIFKPRLAALVRELRAVNADVVVMYHSDGAVAPILGDLIEIGVDVFNPVQPNVPGHEPSALKAAFGGQLSFWGAIDQQYLLPRGTAEEIDRGVASVIHALGAGGGYMCAPAHILQADTPVENVEAFIAAVHRHGDYASGTW